MNSSRFDKQLLAGGLSVLVLAMLVVFSVVFKQNMNTASTQSAAAAQNNSKSTPKPTQKPAQKASPTPTPKDPKAAFRKILNDTLDQIDEQENVDSSLLNELHSGTYSFEKPLVVVDPYNQSPLTALVLFTSSEPLNLSVHVPGEDALTDVDFTFEGYQADHIVPIYGLYPDQNNAVTLTAETQEGKKMQTTLEIETGPLPEELAKTTHITDLVRPDLYQPGLNFTYTNNVRYSKIAFDAHGKIRWCLLTSYKTPSSFYNDHFLFARGDTQYGGIEFVETNPLGRIYRVFYAPYGLHHDLEPYKNDFLATGSQSNSVEDFIYEIDPQTGKIVQTLDLRSVLQRSRDTKFVAVESSDWLHTNAITWVTGTEDILVSGRNQSAVFRISWPEGKIKWILGNSNGWLPMFQKYLLTPSGSNFEWQYNQHAPDILPDQDGNPDTLDVLLFDNGNQRFEFDAELQRKIAANEVVAPENYSRLVQYRINEKTMTVSQIWEFGKEYGSVLYAPARGDANLLANGNRLGFFDIQANYTVANADKNNSANYVEVDPQGQIVWEALGIANTADGKLLEYRVDRAQLYNSADNDLQLGTPVLNLISEDIYEDYGVNH